MFSSTRKHTCVYGRRLARGSAALCVSRQPSGSVCAWPFCVTAAPSADATSTVRARAGCDSEGALYAFPRLTLPDAAQAKAKEDGVAPDFLYCRELLEATGIVAVPGSGFKQVRTLPLCALD